MFVFDQLLTASAKVVRDFVSYIYSKCRSVYLSLKRYLWELQGRFNDYSAFVDMVYGFMDDVEEWEWEHQVSYQDATLALADAQCELSRLQKCAVATEWPTPVIPPAIYTEEVMGRAWDSPVDGEALPPTPVVLEGVPAPCTQELRTNAAVNVVRAMTALDAVKDRLHDAYQKNRGKNYFGKFFNTVSQRMAYIKQAKERREESALLAARVEKRLEISSDIYDFYPMCEVVEVSTGEVLPVKEKEKAKVDADPPSNAAPEGFVSAPAPEDADPPTPSTPKYKTVKQRRILAEHRVAAATWIRHYVRQKNPVLTVGEVSGATITRYVEQFAKTMDLDLASSTFLTQSALRMVPLPTKTDIDTAMIIYSPAARQLRHEAEVISSSVF